MNSEIDGSEYEKAEDEIIRLNNILNEYQYIYTR
jgi:hypothetical protein